jgi:hypothetical protein
MRTLLCFRRALSRRENPAAGLATTAAHHFNGDLEKLFPNRFVGSYQTILGTKSFCLNSVIGAPQW